MSSLPFINNAAAGPTSDCREANIQAAIASAYNQWTLAKWVRPYQCFKGSILCPAQDPEAAAEVRRLGQNPGMVQVLMASAARIPYGNTFY